MGFQSGAPTATRHAAILLAALAGLGPLAGCRGAGSAAAPAATLSASAVAAMQGTRPPQSLVTEAANDVLFAGSVQDVITVSGPGGTITEVTDASVSSGRRVLTLRSSPGTGATVLGRVTILLVSHTGYVYGDPTGLSRLVGIPDDQAGLAAGTWIAVQPGEKLGQADYGSLLGGMTLDSIAASVTLTGTLSPAAPRMVGGQPARGVQGTDPGGGGPARLYVTDKDAPLPLTFAALTGKVPFQASFRRWGERVQLSAPPDPIPASSVTSGSATA